MYAPYWAKYVAELPDMDEEMHLCVLHFYGYVADRAFWEALLRRYPQESPYVWYTALDTIVGCGNVPALNTLETKFDKQTLFIVSTGMAPIIGPCIQRRFNGFCRMKGCTSRCASTCMCSRLGGIGKIDGMPLSKRWVRGPW